MPAGYSHRTLVQKLGIPAGERIAILGAPPGYDRTLGRLPAGVTVGRSARGPLRFIQYFATRRRTLAARMPTLVRNLADAGALWISWPKRASGVETDLTEDAVRAEALAAGLVDVKVCAVDETWSGLKLMRRVKDRGKPRA